MKKSPLKLINKVLGKTSPLNDMAGGLTHAEMHEKSPENLEGHLKNREAHQRGVSRNSSPLNDNGSILQEDPKDQGIPWSQYDSDDIAANKGSGKPLPPQYFRGQRVYPNENDAWQTPKQAQETEDLENSNN